MTESPSPFHGDPFREQRLWSEGRAVVDLSHFDVIEVVGPDAGAFLTALWSQKLDTLAEGASTEALLLDPMGHVEAAAGVVRAGDERFVLLIDPGEGARVAAWLDSMRFMMRVEVRDVSQQRAVVAVRDADQATAALRAISSSSGSLIPDSAIWQDPWANIVEGGVQYAGANSARDDWKLALAVVPEELHDPLIAYLVDSGLLEVGWGAIEALRIEAWRPRFLTEADDRLLPHEVDWLRTAVHIAKGCYRGQETVAKVHNLGHPPRRLVFLHLDGSENVLPEAGDDVVSADGVVVGRVTAAARHWQLGPVALAMVKRALPVDASLSVIRDSVEVAAQQEVIVPPDAGGVAQAEVAALRTARRDAR